MYDGDILLGETTSDAAGNWAFRSAVPLAAADHTITAVSLGPDGKATLRSQPVVFKLVTPPGPVPTAPVAGTVAPAFLLPAAGSTFSTTLPVLVGTATPNSVVRFYDGSKVLGEARADADGRWIFRPAALAEGQHAITAVALNADGSESALRSTVNIRVAAGLGLLVVQPPVLTTTVPALLTNSRPALSGQGTPGSTVRVYDGDKLPGRGQGRPGRELVLRTVCPLAPGAHTLRLEAVGVDGKMVSGAPISFKVADAAAALQPPTIKLPASGQLAAGDTLTGSAAPGSVVQIYDGDTWLGSATAGADGTWRFTLPKTLRPGAHQVRVIVTANDGTALTASASGTVTIGPPLVLPVTGAELAP